MSKTQAPKMAAIQAALHEVEPEISGEEPPTKASVLSIPSLEIANFGEAFRYVMNVILNVLAVTAIVSVIVGATVIGDRLYLSYTDTGSSRFESFLRKQGYESEALAYKQQQQACRDDSDTLELCKGAAWLYRHPEIAVWPSQSIPEPSPKLAEVPGR